jgi:hypothetical protein
LARSHPRNVDDAITTGGGGEQLRGHAGHPGGRAVWGGHLGEGPHHPRPGRRLTGLQDRREAPQWLVTIICTSVADP